ncbi:hypothetical protein BDV26DRAFT_305644 [Aspergillus bertholletiae]|uniref:Uncharacterized protein n=1 Tax=Aspergillus bertholletiae TaxID=1226010 RepID=A0A5N7BLA2_9EURO|nr:hypothetical protein BDV26DRAFT_305644 [Aspergillus bertholletiae]
MEDIRPTAKWANRMLRPLSSIYHRLEKHNEILVSVAHSKLKKRDHAGVIERVRPSRATSAEESCAYSDEEPGDPAWIPGKPIKRRIRHNYSSRGQRNGIRRRSRLSIHSPEQQKALPGAIEIATPLITGKARQPLEASSIRKQLFRTSLSTDSIGVTDQRKAMRTNNGSYSAYQGSWKEVLDLSGDTGLVDIAHFLDRTFIKFLSRTRNNPAPSPNQQQNRGARSLLSMAVRRLPEFIAEEQRIQDELEEGCDVNMCDAYFTELEAHYAPSGNGWLPLREAVRAQGIRLVSEMIHKGWITKAAACRLLEECLSHGEIDAFELLLSKQLTAVKIYDYPTAFDSHRPSTHCDDPVHILGTYYAKCIGSRSFVFDELAKLLSRGIIPPEWMVTNMWKRCVDGAINALSTKWANSAAATRLIEAVILSAGGVSQASNVLASHGKVLGTLRCRVMETRASTSLPKDQSPCPIPIQDALNNLSSSLITALCGMYIARSQATGDGDKVTGVKFRDTLRHLAVTVQRAIGLGQSSEAGMTTLHSLRRGHVLIGDCMLQCGEESSLEPVGPSDPISRRNMELFFLSLASQHDMVKELAELARSILKFYERTHKSDQTRVSSGVRSKVSQLAGLTNIYGFASLLAKVAAETAMGLAESTLDVDDQTWAIEVQQNAVSLQQDRSPKQSPASDSGNEALDNSIGLYRWEEIIGEWVASTPAAKPKSTLLNVAKGNSTRLATIACSTSSISSSSSPSQAATSSVTSSAPSVSVKRAHMPAGVGPQSSKRLRSTPAESQTRDSPIATTLPSPIAARTRAARGALKDSTQPKVPKSFSISTSFPTTKVEVVIVNKNVSALDPMARRRPYRTTGERADSRQRKSLPATLERRAVSKTPQRTPSITRRTVLCSQDDESDDELSFL